MHESSLDRMNEFIKKYLNFDKKLRILDVGSHNVGSDVNNTYRNLFDSSTWEYVGGDIVKGMNVDLVFKMPYDWGVPNESFDVVVSGQCLEHVEDVKKWVTQIQKVLKANGLVCIIAPWTYPEHKFPIDCWRILPDGMRFLLEEICEFEILEIFCKYEDCVGIARKKGNK